MFKVLLSLFILLAPINDVEFPQYVQLEVLDVHDGDTIKANVHLPGGVSLNNESVRFNYDAWEVGRRNGQKVTDEEIVKGKKARQDLLDIFERSSTIYGTFFAKSNRDSFGRLLIKPTAKLKDGSILNISEEMKSKGNLR
jgi:hypothetical protein